MRNSELKKYFPNILNEKMDDIREMAADFISGYIEYLKEYDPHAFNSIKTLEDALEEIEAIEFEEG